MPKNGCRAAGIEAAARVLFGKATALERPGRHVGEPEEFEDADGEMVSLGRPWEVLGWDDCGDNCRAMFLTRAEETIGAYEAVVNSEAGGVDYDG